MEEFVAELSAIFDEIGLVRLLFDSFDDSPSRLVAAGKRLLDEGYVHAAAVRFIEASGHDDAEATGLAAFWCLQLHDTYSRVTALAERGVALGDMTAAAVLGRVLCTHSIDPARGMQLMESAVAANNPHGMYLLQEYLDRNSARSLELLRRAVDLGFCLAFNVLARAGITVGPNLTWVLPDLTYSITLLERGAALNDMGCVSTLRGLCVQGMYKPHGAESLAVLKEQLSELYRRYRPRR